MAFSVLVFSVEFENKGDLRQIKSTTGLGNQLKSKKLREFLALQPLFRTPRFSLSRQFAGDAFTYPPRPTGSLREILGQPGQSYPQIPKP